MPAVSNVYSRSWLPAYGCLFGGQKTRRQNRCVLYDCQDIEGELAIECNFKTSMYFIMVYLVCNIWICTEWQRNEAEWTMENNFEIVMYFTLYVFMFHEEYLNLHKLLWYCKITVQCMICNLLKQQNCSGKCSSVHLKKMVLSKLVCFKMIFLWI